MKSPITDKSLGVVLDHETKFADVRSKAHEEYVERKRKYKRDKTIKIPNYKVGDLVVLVISHSKDRQYLLAKVIDWYENQYYEFEYYAIIQKVTNPKELNRIGRITHFTERRSWFGHEAVVVEDKLIKWI